jgi:hypothetical protein
LPGFGRRQRERCRDRMRQTTTAEVGHGDGKAPSFMRHAAGTHRFRCLRHPSRLGLFAQNQKMALACPAIRGKTFS